LKQRSSEISLSRQSSQVKQQEVVRAPASPLLNKDGKPKLADIKVSSAESVTTEGGKSTTKAASAVVNVAPLREENAEDIADNISKHKQEVSDHLQNLANAIKENTNQETFEALSIEERSSRLEEEFIGKASKARQEMPITRICLTGGPCAGKTTALAELQLVLNQMGFRVLLVPEAAMILKKGGLNIDARTMTFTQAVRFQKLLMKLQMDLEQIFIDVA